jgi:hypothetical protein
MQQHAGMFLSTAPASVSSPHLYRALVLALQSFLAQVHLVQLVPRTAQIPSKLLLLINQDKTVTYPSLNISLPCLIHRRMTLPSLATP